MAKVPGVSSLPVLAWLQLSQHSPVSRPGVHIAAISTQLGVKSGYCGSRRPAGCACRPGVVYFLTLSSEYGRLTYDAFVVGGPADGTCARLEEEFW